MSKCVKCGNEILTGDIHWEMGLCNNCYNELYKDHKTYISLDKMWLNIAQRFRDENEKLQDKIADLEAKLAESEENIKLLEQDRVVICNTMDMYREKVEELKQQLAEKEQTIEEINKEFMQAVKDWKLLVEQKNKDIAELEEHDRVYHNQLAIDELEKVQSALYSIPTPYDMITSLPISGNTFSNGFHKGMYKVIELIDNQIKQLKEMK